MRAVLMAVMAWVALSRVVLAEGLVDCTGDAFRASLKLEPDYGFDCVEISRITPPVDGGRWTIRALRNASTEEGYVKVYAEEYMAAAQAAFVAWEPYVTGLGLQYGNVSLVFTDPEGSEIDFFDYVVGHGYVNGLAHADGSSFPQDCVVSVNMAEMTKFEVAKVSSNMAHELFHCVQFWSLPSGATNPGGGAQAWWQEGSANFFAALVFPDPGRTAEGAEAFLATIHEKPLTQQAYNATIFFAFLNQQGMSTLDAFFKGLATSPGEIAQMEATESALGEEMLQKFAEAVVDGTISLPSGFVFPAFENPEPFIFSQDGQFEAGKISFTVDARLISFVGGSYAVAQTAYQARPAGGGPWGPMPNLVEPAQCKEPVEFLVTRFVGTSFAETMGSPFVATRYAECVICQTLPDLDQCLVGTWQLRDSSMLDYLRMSGEGMEAVKFKSVTGVVKLEVKPGGKARWISEKLTVQSWVSGGGSLPSALVLVEADGSMSGRWSSNGINMHFCAESAEMKFKSTVKLDGSTEDIVVTKPPLSDSYLAYTCTPSTLKLTFVGPVPAMGVAPEWTMDKIK